VLLPSLEVDGQVHESWQEAVEKPIRAPRFLRLQDLSSEPLRHEFFFCLASCAEQTLRDSQDRVAGVIVRDIPFVSTHTLLGISGGEFVSLLEPSEELRDAAGCRNEGTSIRVFGYIPKRDNPIPASIAEVTRILL